MCLVWVPWGLKFVSSSVEKIIYAWVLKIVRGFFPPNSCSYCHSCLATITCIHPIPQITNLSLFAPLHTTPPPVLLIHHQFACIFHSQNLFPTSGSPSLLSLIFNGSISRISHTTLNLPLLISHEYHMDLPYYRHFTFCPTHYHFCLSLVRRQTLTGGKIMEIPLLFLDFGMCENSWTKLFYCFICLSFLNVCRTHFNF